jgi:hypothetical protein
LEQLLGQFQQIQNQHTHFQELRQLHVEQQHPQQRQDSLDQSQQQVASALLNITTVSFSFCHAAKLHVSGMLLELREGLSSPLAQDHLYIAECHWGVRIVAGHEAPDLKTGLLINTFLPSKKFCNGRTPKESVRETGRGCHL